MEEKTSLQEILNQCPFDNVVAIDLETLDFRYDTDYGKAMDKLRKTNNKGEIACVYNHNPNKTYAFRAVSRKTNKLYAEAA